MTSLLDTARCASLVGLALLGGALPANGARGDIESRVLKARDRVFPALVHVEPILEVFRGGERGRVAVTGSGVIISAEGLVVTNAHVVERAERVTCVLSDRREIPAEVVGRDEATDLALLRLDPAGVSGAPLPVAEMGRSADVQEGQWVMAMGSPLGLARSVSLGVVSSANRYLPGGQLPGGSETGLYNTWIQTDAAINPGNSGGPLVDLSGRIVGINARAVTVFGENVGFAIPVDVVRSVLPQLEEGGRVRRSYAGLHLQSLRALPRSAREGLPEGVIVGGVDEGSPAGRAGIRTGDVIVSWGGTATEARFDDQLPGVRRLMASSPPGVPISVGLWRDGGPREVSLSPLDGLAGTADQVEAREWGFTVRAVDSQFARDHNLVEERGVVVTGVKKGSFAEKARLTAGSVILRLREEAVDDLEDFSRLYDEAVEARDERILVQTRSGVVFAWTVIEPEYGGDEEEDDEAL